MPRGRPENPTIAAIEDALAALSHISESTAILLARSGGVMRADDIDEFERLIAATERCYTYLSDLRRQLGAGYINEKYR